MFALEGPKVEKRGEIEVTRFTMRLTEEGLAAMTADAEAELEAEELKRMMDAIYGKDGLRFAMAGANGRVAFAMGGDDAFLDSTLRRMSTQGEAPPAMQRLLQRIGGANPSMLFHMDVAKLIGQVAQLAPMMGPDVDPDEIPDVSDLSAPMTFYGRVRGLEWSGGLSLDIAKLAKLVERMEQ